MKALRVFAIISVGIFPHFIIPSHDLYPKIPAAIDVRINKNADLKNRVFEGLPNEVGFEVFGCNDESRTPSVRDGLNYRQVNKDWSKLFVIFMWYPHLKLQGSFFGYYGHTLDSHDNIPIEPQFNDKEVQKMVDLMRQKKLVMGEFSISEKEKSEIGLQAFLSEMIKSEAPSFRIVNADTELPSLLAKMMPENNYVKHITLPHTHTIESQKAIGELVKKCKNLRYLKMRNSYIGDTGAKAVAAALKDHQKLEYIDWEGNDITDSGAAALAKALETNKSLKTFKLHGNRIGWEGAQALALSLRKNDTLEKLDLRSENTESWKWVGDNSQSIRNVRRHVQEKGSKKRMLMIEEN